MRVTLDVNACMGHALCNAAGPDVYHLDDQGHCVLAWTEIPAELADQAVRGADACPERALVVSD